MNKLDEIKQRAIEANKSADKYGSMTSDDFGHNTHDLMLAEVSALYIFTEDIAPKLASDVILLVDEVIELRKALGATKDIVDTDYMKTETDEDEEEYWVNQMQVEAHIDEALEASKKRISE